RSRLAGVASEYDRAFRLDDQDRQWWRLRMEPQLVADLQMLIFGNDMVGVVHPAAHQVLEPRVAVKAALVLADLHKPWPNCRDRRVDGNGMGRLSTHMRGQLVAGQRHSRFFLRRAPVEMAGPQPKRICRARSRNGTDRQ